MAPTNMPFNFVFYLLLFLFVKVNSLYSLLLLHSPDHSKNAQWFQPIDGRGGGGFLEFTICLWPIDLCFRGICSKRLTQKALKLSPCYHATKDWWHNNWASPYNWAKGRGLMPPLPSTSRMWWVIQLHLPPPLSFNPRFSSFPYNISTVVRLFPCLESPQKVCNGHWCTSYMWIPSVPRQSTKLYIHCSRND